MKREGMELSVFGDEERRALTLHTVKEKHETWRKLFLAVSSIFFHLFSLFFFFFIFFSFLLVS
jgi:hypothetical protein